MKKTLLTLAIAGAVAGYGANAAAADVAVSGFVDAFYTITDDATVANESWFTVPETEVDFSAGGVRVDLNSSSLGAATVEQANFTAGLAQGWSVTVGRVNSLLTDDVQDAPDMEFSTNTLLFGELRGAIAMNLTGVTVSGPVGPANLSVGLVNDESSVAPDRKSAVYLRVGGSAMPGLDLELGYLSQDAGGGDLLDINGKYTVSGATIGLDYMQADPTTGGQFDTGYNFWAGYDFGNGFAVKGRIGNTETKAGTKTDANTIYASYAVSKNFSLALQSENIDNSVTDDNTTTLEFIGKF